jgi:ArsR family transcriptional regulator, virulence genes transcriptional regulator
MKEETLYWAEKQARFYQTLTCPRRLLILWALAERELSVGEIASEVGATMQNTSQHLSLMKKRGILDSRRDGQTIYYSVVDHKLLIKMGIPDQKRIIEKL